MNAHQQPRAERRYINLRPGENFWYHFYCVITLGGAYFLKLIIKKAIMEARNPGQEFTAEERRAFLQTGQEPGQEPGR
jgi:hypothetical protein